MSDPQTNQPTDNALQLRAEKRAEMATVDFERGKQLFQPRNARELMDMAQLMSGAGLMVKDIFRGPQGQGNCMGLIAICAPYGISPIQASWKVYQTKPDAPMAYEAQLVTAMVNASGVLQDGFDYQFSGEGPTRSVKVIGSLKGGGSPKEVDTPMVKDIKVKNSPLWVSDPDQQLCYYGARAWVRRHKPEMLLGIYTTDEVPSGPDHARDVTPRSAPARGGVIYRDEPAIEQQKEPSPTNGAGEILEHDADGVVVDGPTPEQIAAAEEAALAARTQEPAE